MFLLDCCSCRRKAATQDLRLVLVLQERFRSYLISGTEEICYVLLCRCACQLARSCLPGSVSLASGSLGLGRTVHRILAFRPGLRGCPWWCLSWQTCRFSWRLWRLSSGFQLHHWLVLLSSRLLQAPRSSYRLTLIRDREYLKWFRLLVRWIGLHGQIIANERRLSWRP